MGAMVKNVVKRIAKKKRRQTVNPAAKKAMVKNADKILLAYGTSPDLVGSFFYRMFSSSFK